MKHNFLKQVILSLILLIAFAFNAQSQKCDCGIYPFKPDSCAKKCMAMILQTADTLELTLILGLESKLSSELYTIRGRDSISSVGQLKDFLQPAEFKKVTESLKRLNESQAKYFTIPFDKRKDILAEWKNLDLNKRVI